MNHPAATPPRPALPSSVEQLTARLLPQVLLIASMGALMTALADLGRPDDQDLLAKCVLYVVLLAIGPIVWLLYQSRILGGVASSLLADAGISLVLILRLLLGQASLSGTALFICIKILATALLLPWGGQIQFFAASATTVLYWIAVFVHGDAIEPADWLHQIAAPAIATILSVGGATIAARVRREHDAAEAQLSQALSQTRRAENEKASLLEIARGMSGTVDLKEVVERLQGLTASVLDCDSVATFVNDDDGQSFHLIGAHSPIGDLRSEALAASFPRHAEAMEPLEHGKSIVAAGPSSQAFIAPEILVHFQVRHIIISPLRVAGRFFGGLVAVRTLSDVPFEPHHVELLEAIAGQLALVLEVIEVYRQAQEEAEASGTVARVARALMEAGATTALMPRLCELLREALDCEVTIVGVRDPDATHFVGTAASGLSSEESDTMRLLAIPVAFAEERIRAIGYGEAWQFGIQAPPQSLVQAFAARLGVTQLLLVPLQHTDTLVGFLAAAYRGKRRSFSARQVKTAKSICQFAALVWQNTQLIEQLAEANRLQADFVDTMSHELRTPLNIITGYTDLLLDDAFGALQAEQQSTLQRVARSAQELLEIVNTTLQVSRLDTGRLPIEAFSFSIAELIDEIAVETRALWDRPGLMLTWAVTKAVPEIISDRPKLKVVLKNLIGNAAKFTATGQIRIHADTVDTGVRIDVSDTGCGIPAEALPIIFQRFRQADSSMTRHYGGVGLGLYIVSRLIEMLGGSIDVESTAGQGSTFSIWLPQRPGVRGRDHGSVGSRFRDLEGRAPARSNR